MMKPWNGGKKPMNKSITACKKIIKRISPLEKRVPKNSQECDNLNIRFEGKINSCNKYGYIYK